MITVKVIFSHVQQTHLFWSSVIYSSDMICLRQLTIDVNTKESKWGWSRNSHILENYLCVNVVAIRKYNKSRSVCIEFDLTYLTPVEDLINILSKGSGNVVSGINYLLVDLCLRHSYWLYCKNFKLSRWEMWLLSSVSKTLDKIDVKAI